MKIAACFLEYDDRFVILLRHDHKSDGGTWGLPAGKLEQNESPADAVIREVYEETGHKVACQDLEYLADFTFGQDKKVYDITVYRVVLTSKINVQIERSEHAEYRWVTAEECYGLPNLVPDFHEALRLLGYVKQPQ